MTFAGIRECTLAWPGAQCARRKGATWRAAVASAGGGELPLDLVWQIVARTLDQLAQPHAPGDHEQQVEVARVWCDAPALTRGPGAG